MHIDPLERAWVWIVGFITAAMLGVIFFTAFFIGAGGFHPPSNVETLDSALVHLPEGVDGSKSSEFNEDNLGVERNADGSITLRMVGARYGFYPQDVVVPSDTRVTLRIVSADTIHGFHVEKTNMASMLIPGFVSEVTTEFRNPGVYPMFCNEYCGIGHHYMWGRLTVVTPEEFAAREGSIPVALRTEEK